MTSLNPKQRARKAIKQARSPYELNDALTAYLDAYHYPPEVVDVAVKQIMAKELLKMAKPYRQAPLIGADLDSGLPLQEQRIEKSAQLLGKMTSRFDDEYVLHVATEIGLDECIQYDPDGKALVYDLTALQLVSLSSALAACAEYRDAIQPPMPRWRCRSCRHSWRSRKQQHVCPNCKSERVRELSSDA